MSFSDMLKPNLFYGRKEGKYHAVGMEKPRDSDIKTT